VQQWRRERERARKHWRRDARVNDHDAADGAEPAIPEKISDVRVCGGRAGGGGGGAM